MQIVYENDSNGGYVSGNKQDLLDAAQVGKKIACKVTNAAGHTEVFFFERLIVATDNHLYAVTPLRLANFELNSSSASGTQFSYYANPFVSIFCTRGIEIVKGTSVWVNPLNMKWYVE